MEKYGFVYIWRDRKHNRYYIGSHWGTEDDGYVCSSNRTRNAYNRRPEDFKRRIIEKCFTNRKELFEIEQKWLNFIKPEELKLKYYNMQLNVGNPWYANPEDSKRPIREKISIRLKAKYQNDSEWSVSRRKHMSDVGKQGLSIETQFQSGQKAWNDGLIGAQVAWNKDKTNMPWSGKARPDVSLNLTINNPNADGSSMRGKHHSEESKIKSSLSNIGQKRSEETKARLKAHHQGRFWWNNGIEVKKQKECPGDNWVRGRKLNTGIN